MAKREEMRFVCYVLTYVRTHVRNFVFNSLEKETAEITRNFYAGAKIAL